MKKKNITGLLVTMAVFAAVISLSIYFFSNSEPTYLQGQVEPNRSMLPLRYLVGSRLSTNKKVIKCTKATYF